MIFSETGLGSLTPERFGRALMVKDHAFDLVNSVISGAITLDIAYEQAQARKKAKDWRDNGLAELRKVDPVQCLCDIDLCSGIHWISRKHDQTARL